MKDKQNKIFVNGAWIDRDFFEENLNDAKTVSWRPSVVEIEDDHHHCMICNKAIGPFIDEQVYESTIGWLCSYCYEHFILK